MNKIIETNENIELNDYSNCVDEKSWSVYLHTVPKEISGYDWDKYYVGITKRKPEYRWGKNGNGYKRQVFWNAIQKYGWDNIRHEVLFADLTLKDAPKNVPLCLVVGSEGFGISRLVKSNCDLIAKIPMFGRVNCLNASVATSIALFALKTQ